MKPRSSSSSSSLIATTASESSVDGPPIDGPQELRKALLDFSVAFLKDKPKDVINYAVNYFTGIQINRHKLREVTEPSIANQSRESTFTAIVRLANKKDHTVTERGRPYLRTTEWRGSVIRSLSESTALPRRTSIKRDSARKSVENRVSIRSALEHRSGNRRSYSEGRSSERRSAENKNTGNLNLNEPPPTSLYSYEPLPRRKSIFIESYDTGDRADEEEIRPFSQFWHDNDKPAGMVPRRKSVFAESFEPDEDDSEEGDAKPKIEKSPEQAKRLRNSIKKVLIFKSLDREQLHDVVRSMTERRVCAGEIIAEQDTPANELFIIDKGTFKVYKDDIHVYTFTNEGIMGELALISTRLRLTTIKATTDGVLWTVDRRTYRHILESKAYYKRKFYEKQLRKVYMLQVLPKDKLLNLADALQEKTYNFGEAIFKQGDKPDGMYIVIEGVVQIKATDNIGFEKNVHKIGGSQNYFDELALLKIKSKSKSAIAKDVHKIGETQIFFGELALLKTHHTRRLVSAYAASHHVRLAFLSLDSFDRIVGDSAKDCYESIGDNHPHYSNLLKFYRSLNIAGKLL